MDVRNLVGSTRLTVRSTLRYDVIKLFYLLGALGCKINPRRHNAYVSRCVSCVKFFFKEHS